MALSLMPASLAARGPVLDSLRAAGLVWAAYSTCPRGHLEERKPGLGHCKLIALPDSRISDRVSAVHVVAAAETGHATEARGHRSAVERTRLVQVVADIEGHTASPVGCIHSIAAADDLHSYRVRLEPAEDLLVALGTHDLADVAVGILGRNAAHVHSHSACLHFHSPGRSLR